MIYGAAPLTIAGLAATTVAVPAGAAVRPPPRRVAIGSMELGGPLQYERFRALQGFGLNRGGVEYTNWEYAEPGTGVYAPQQGQHALTFALGADQYAHTLNGGLQLVARSPEVLLFRGNGAYDAQAGATWRIRGAVMGNHLFARIVYNGNLNPGYSVVLRGTITPAGGVTGTALSSQGQRMTFAMPDGTMVSVLHYHARIQGDRIGRHDATFRFTIPAGSLAGTQVTVKAHDGGWGPAGDSYTHGTGVILNPYPILGGPGVTVYRVR